MAYHRLVVLTTGGRFKPQPPVIRATSDSSSFFVKQKSPLGKTYALLLRI